MVSSAQCNRDNNSPQDGRAAPDGARAGEVYLVGAGPGDEGLLTVRGAELLASADVVLHDELVHPAVLGLARPDADVQHVGKRGGTPLAKQATQDDIERRLVELARAGRSVVRLKGGDPFLFGRGSEEAEALAAAGVPFEIVPGVCSPIAAAAYAGISLTHRDHATSVTFVSGTTRKGEGFDWGELESVRGTLCVLMGLRRLEEITQALADSKARRPDTPAAVISKGTRADQRVVRGTLADIASRARDAGLESPALMVVGPVVELRDVIRWYDRRPLFGKRVLVTRPSGQAETTARSLRRRGADPIELPTIRLGSPPDWDQVLRAVADLESDQYEYVVFTSANGVAWFWKAIEQRQADARVFGRARIAAIGPATDRALRDHGVRADIVPTSFVAEELAAAILEDGSKRGIRDARVLLPRARVAREVLPETLRAGGHRVDVLPVYETRPADDDARSQLVTSLRERAIDIVLLTSSSTVDSLCELTAPNTAALLAGLTIASIGPITTATAEKHGLQVAVTATHSTSDGLIAALEDAMSTAG